ncbi:double-headed protease inhibitor, submandibular gland-like [Antedon mediterranea]|uniref:double-headed protease inhibitor, submandibular gland-like n=1 Tax=Antedon mediterranea TaxID=105859 RepID=UPI003AF9053E
MAAFANILLLLISVTFVISIAAEPMDLDCQSLLRKCPDNTTSIGPICGNDHRNYRHLCHLLRRKCKMNLPMLEKAHDRKCRVVEVKHCPKKCETGTKLSKVCGTDGRTYTTACAVRRRACRVAPELEIAHSGRCPDDIPKKKKRPTEPVVEIPEEEESMEVIEEEEATEVPMEEEVVVVEILEIGTTELPDV